MAVTISEEENKKHYRDTYFYDGTRQANSGNFFERYWFRVRIKRISKDLRRLPQARILEIGCGTGEISEGISASMPQAKIIATDISPRAIAKCIEYHPKSPVSYKVADAFHLPYKDSSFDAVVAVEVIEHTVNPEVMIKETARVLKPGGILIINTPFKFHPIWNLEWLRQFISTENKEDYKPGGIHSEPVHHSYTASGLKKLLPKELRYLSHKHIALGVTLHMTAQKLEQKEKYNPSR